MEENNHTSFNQADDTEQTDGQRFALPGSTSVRSTALIALTAMAAVVFMDWAQDVLLPLVVSVLLSYSLDPVVSVFDRLKIPRAISAAVVLLSLTALVAVASLPLQREAMAMLDKVPDAVSKFKYRSSLEPNAEEGVIEKAQKAAEEIEQVASNDTDPGQARENATPVRIVEKPLNIREYLMTGSSGALMGFTQFFSVLLLVYFLLAVGSLYKRKAVRMAGPSFQRRRKTVHILGEFHYQVRRFLFVMLMGAVFVGALSWLAFVLLGFEQAIFWGVMAGVASAIPYLGPLLVMLGTAVAAFLQFGSMEMAILISATSLGITSIQGYLLMPWLTAHVSSLNTVAIFVGLLFWGWLWGALGLIIAMPLLMIAKTLCDHVENLRPLGDLLGK